MAGLGAHWTAALLLLAAAAAAPAAAHDGPRPLSCPPSIVPGVLSCADSGNVVAGRSASAGRRRR